MFLTSDDDATPDEIGVLAEVTDSHQSNSASWNVPGEFGGPFPGSTARHVITASASVAKPGEHAFDERSVVGIIQSTQMRHRILAEAGLWRLARQDDMHAHAEWPSSTASDLVSAFATALLAR